MAQVEILLGHSPNTLHWELANLGGEAFEDAVVGSVQSYFAEHYPTVTCLPTPRRSDGGRDLTIEACEPVCLCGVMLHPNRTGILRAAIEIKSKIRNPRERLDEKAYSRSLTQLDRDRFDYFVLVTNGTLTPRAARQTADLLAPHDVEFVVIDEARLFDFLSTTPVGRRLIAGTKRPADWIGSSFVVEAQIHRSRLNDEIDIVVDLWFRNYSERLLPVEMLLRADTGWHSTLPTLRTSIDPHRDLMLKFQAKGAGVEDSEIVLAFRVDDSAEMLARIVAANAKFDFTPPLHGEQHLRSVAEIRDAVLRDLPFALISVTGEAGTGKSRVVSEAITAAANQSRKVYRALIDRSQPARSVRDVRERVHKGLGKADWHARENEGPGAMLARLVREIDHPFYSIVIILEDLHHSSDDVIAALKELLTQTRPPDKAPVTLIITGRDDFTFPNQAYFTLLDLVATPPRLECVSAIKLSPLTRAAARALVRNVVDEMPSDAVARIVELSENVPFCLIEIIEHLLEAGVAKLRRSNRAGIPNPFRFADRTHLPASMKEIYAARIQSLRAVPGGDRAWRYLSIATYFGQAIPAELGTMLFGAPEGAAVTQLLLSRRFLLRSIEDALEWGHENWLHFVRQQIDADATSVTLARQILDNSKLRAFFDGLELAHLCALANRFAEALAHYHPAVAAARNVQNLSAADIDAAFFKHLPQVYRSLQETGGAIEDRISVLVAYAYLGNHAIAGQEGLAAVSWARREADGLTLPDTLRDPTRARLKQVENHVLMESGEIGRAERQLLELATQIQLNPALASAFDVKFDLYNRLQDIYRFRNHLQLAEDFGRMAHHAAEQLGTRHAW